MWGADCILCFNPPSCVCGLGIITLKNVANMWKALFVGTGMLQWNIFLLATKAFSRSCSEVPVIGSTVETCPLPPAGSVLFCHRESWHQRNGVVPPHSPTPNLPHHQPLWVTDKRQTGGLIAFLAEVLEPAPPSSTEECRREKQVFSPHSHTHTIPVYPHTKHI